MSSWLVQCCWVYNQALDQRIKAWKRRGESISLYTQCKTMTGWRERISSLRTCPSYFERDAVRRVDNAFRGFFSRLKSKTKCGLPRRKPVNRYCSMRYLQTARYIRGTHMYVPVLGLIRCRGANTPDGRQICLRLIKKPTGWYANVDVEVAKTRTCGSGCIGVDVGVNTFMACSDGRTITSLRLWNRFRQKLKLLNRRISRRKKGSANRKKAIRSYAALNQRIHRMRRGFCHQHSSELVKNNRLIAVENLNVKGLIKGRLGNQIQDASWSTFTAMLHSKAEEAGSVVIAVNARGTSQTCPDCGAIKKKTLSERVHRCPCGCVMDRDVAAAKVILARALELAGAQRPWRDSVQAGSKITAKQSEPFESVSPFTTKV